MSASEDHLTLARNAYVYGFPLVFNLEQVARYVFEGVGANPAAPFNQFSHARSLASPDDRFVTINNDTVYSFAQLDLTSGPMLLRVPDTDDRYYVLQFISAWTDNFAYVGKRATGTKAGEFVLVPPNWTDPLPSGVPAIHFPTSIATINGRWAVSDPSELITVAALQDQLSLTPLGSAAAASLGLPPVGQQDNEALDFWEKYRVWSQAYPPAPRDVGTQSSFAELGLTGDTPVSQLSPDVRRVLEDGYTIGQQFVEAAIRGGFTPELNGWLLTLHAFDYNLDHFEVGAIDSPDWKIEDPTLRLIMRAGASLGGLWGNHAYEAAYLGTYVDDRGEQLDGSRTYKLTLDPPPPSDAFWSLTMYDVPNYFLVRNPLQRYSVGDRTPGVVRSPGGGVEITISHSEPTDPTERANWLPAPAGPFRPMLRVYLPSVEVLDGSYTLPPILRIQDHSDDRADT